MARLLQFAML